MTTALDNAFADELDEIIERALLAYRPILSHAVMGQFRTNLQLIVHASDNLKPWLARGQFQPAHGLGSLTAGQVALLGGTRPTRALHSVASWLSVPLDGGDQKGLRTVGQILHHSTEALESLVEHHVVVAVKEGEARLRKLREVVRLGIAAQAAAMMGAQQELGLWAERDDLEEPSELVRRYFLAAHQAFGRIKLSRADQDVFRDYYIEALPIDELAEERDRGLDAEVERRRAFLKRLAAALEAQCELMARTAGRPGAGGSAPEVLAGSGREGSTRDAEPRALTQATARAARPRKR
jgi:hypothetical protein